MAARHRVVLVLAGAGALAAAVSLVTVLVVRGGGTTERPPPLAVAGPVAGPPPPAPSSAGIVVSVVGRVASPGVISLPDGSRVADAIHAVGGVAAGVDAGSLNLARRLADGEQLHVGVPAPPGADPPEVGSRQPGSPAAKIDLNTATVAQLDTLPGVGQVTAQRIVDHRTRHGRFTTVDQLGQVDGIGRTRLGRLRDLVVVR
jgi:competence protein ComEA